MRSFHALLLFLLITESSTFLFKPVVKHTSSALSLTQDDPARRRSRPERIPPSNPEEVDAARRGEWNYETGCIEKKEESPDDEIDYSEY